MAKTVPFLFCRYSMHIDDELLDVAGTFEALNEIQGKYLPANSKAEKAGVNSIVVMRPRRQEIAGEDVVTWAIGHRPGHRTVTNYDAQNQEIKFAVQDDTHILHTGMLALPRLRVMAVNDRINALNMGGRPALSRTKAAFRQIPDGAFAYQFLAPGDIESIRDELDLIEYSYTVRRINPTSPSALAKALDESMEKEGVGVYRGTARPMPGGDAMHANEGIIEAASDLAAAGYGVQGFKGHTQGGHLAQIKKPPFSLEKKENLKQQEKEHPLRVFIESEQDDDELTASVVQELVRFYDHHDGAPDLSAEPA